MSDAPTIFFAGGGTGGHLYPGISVAQALQKQAPDARCVFLCTTREIDRTILEPTGFEFIPQPIVPPRSSIGGLLKFFRSWRETKDQVRQLLRERKPAAVLGLGGYAAGVAVKLAAVRDIPTAILNPDLIPGKANQYLMRHVRAVCCQFEQSRSHVNKVYRSKLIVTGCPIRDDIRHLPAREHAAKRLGLDAALHTLVVTGASPGATTVTDAVAGAAPQLKLQGWQILHLSGKDHAPAVRDAYRNSNVSAAVIDFTPAMADVWAVASLAISRAGASSCAELTACGVPSMLMPYPFHKDMHQRANAKVLADAGAALIVDDQREASKNVPALRAAIESLLYDAPKRAEMSAAAKSLGKPDASDAVARVLTDLVRAGR
jgi:UDP-N-acetylglucosamine--N-acetylmuramyl-(pentapeptide) pyrophosphoryl-undecaprenol N-acetylglucosamine transferase